MTTRTTIIATAAATATLAIGVALGAQAVGSGSNPAQGPRQGRAADHGTGHAMGTGQGARGASAGVSQVPATEQADATLATTLQLMREEERLARDLYAALATEHDGARPMSMITNSEQKHFDALGTLLQTYGVSDPSQGKPAGTYAFPEIQALYDQWWAEGKVSLPAAYQVGIELETRDIADLTSAINSITEADIDRVLGNLLRGSENHLAAYQAAASGTPSTTTGMRQSPSKGLHQDPSRQGQHDCPLDAAR